MDVSAFAVQLRDVECRYAPAGEASRAAYANQLAEWRRKEQEPDSEQVCSTGDATGAWLLLWLCARYGIRTSRRPRQKPTTICVHAPKSFVTKVLGPQLQDMTVVFDQARAKVVDEVVTAWLGPEASAAPLFVDEAPRSA